jgi:hypothetical protein
VDADFTSKLEIGSPMACLYILGNPDHYTNLQFKVCWWRSYLHVARKDWQEDTGFLAPYAENVESVDAEVTSQPDRAVLMERKGVYVGATHVDDYVYRPKEYEYCSVYDFVQVSTRIKRSPKQLADFLASLEEDSHAMEVDHPSDDDSFIDDDLGPHAGKEALDELASYSFGEGHPLRKTHYVQWDRRELN